MSEPIAYPPEPTTLEVAMQEGISWRQDIDHKRWWHGWRYQQIRRKWPDVTADMYADGVGITRTSFRSMYRAASQFTPEHVNLFPGLPIDMWAMVADIAEKDMEEALNLIENAYDTPGLTVRDFKEIIAPFSTPLLQSTTPPIRVYGNIEQPKREGKWLVVPVRLDTELEDWAAILAKTPYLDTAVEVTIRLAGNVRVR